MHHNQKHIVEILVKYHQNLSGKLEGGRIKSSKSIYAQHHILNKEQQIELLEPITDANIKKVL